MGVIYKLSVKIRDESDIKAYQNALDTVFALGKKLLESKNPKTKKYLQDIGDEYKQWLWSTDTSLSAIAEQLVEFDLHDAKNATPGTIVTVDFGKAYPAPIDFIAATFAIFSHFLPHADIHDDAYDDEKQFAAGVLLAKQMIPEIKNPLPPLGGDHDEE